MGEACLLSSPVCTSPPPPPSHSISGSPFPRPSLHSSPMLKKHIRIIDMLRDPDAECWLPVSGFAGWSELKMAAAGTEAFKVVAGIWLRCVREFQNWPWRLVGCFDMDEPLHERLRVCTQFLACDASHMDPGFGAPIRHAVGAASAEDLAGRHDIRRIVEHTFKKVECHNIHNEDRFARQCRYLGLKLSETLHCTRWGGRAEVDGWMGGWAGVCVHGLVGD